MGRIVSESFLDRVDISDIGSEPNEIPINANLGKYAYMSPDSFVAALSGSSTPHNVGDMVFQLTSDTSLTIKVKGSDGVIRSANITLE